MDLKIKDVASFLNVSETTIRRWITDGKIPVYRINQQYRFSRTEIENWVISHKLDKTHRVSSFTKSRLTKEKDNLATEKTKGGVKQFGLFRAIHKGDVLAEMPGRTKEEVIRATMKLIAKNLHLDADVMADLLLDRESLMPTALNNSIAVPHTRDILLNAHHDVVFIVFLKTPLHYGALDGQPVHTLFFLFACEDKRHLSLLAKIAHLSHQPKSLEFLLSKPSKKELLIFIKKWEAQLHLTTSL